MDHAERLRLADRVTRLLMKWHPEMLAVAVTGSTAKGEDREHSDLEMTVITRDMPRVRAYSAVHEGIVVEVIFQSLRDAERETSEIGSSWPVSIDEWIHVLPTSDPNNIFKRLAHIAANPSAEKLTKSLSFRLTAAYEDLCKLRNFATAAEDDLLRFMSPFFALNIAIFLGFLNGEYYNGLRNIITKSSSLKDLPKHFSEDFIPLMNVTAPTASILDHAERLFAECSDLLRDRGFRWPPEDDLEAALRAGKIEATMSG